MKRNSLLGISLLLFPVLAWAQGKITRHGLQIDRQQRPVAITGEERPGEIARTVKPHSGNRTGAVGPGVLLMESHYDYGSNGGVLTNLWDYGDGTLAVARMAATQGPAPTSPDRGTFFSYFDGFTWTPMSKVEQSRRGWSNISSVIDGRSVVSSHTIGSVLEVNVDALKGLGIWTSAITGFTTNLNTGWPRLTVDGRDNIIVCSSIDGLVDSLQGLKEIAISRDQGSTWSLQVLFPEISTRTPIFRVDDQAIDSFGDKVAVAVAELGGDIHLWESLDNGATWQYRNVTNYPLDVQPGAEELRPYIACDVIYDNDGDLHIFWETVLATQDAPGTELELFFSRNAGIQHWSENTAQVQTVAWADLSGAELESDQQLFVAGSPFNQVNATMSLVGQPQAGVDANGSLFLLFAALRPLDFDVADSTHFTDVFAVRSDDDGAAWGVPVNVTDTPQSEDLWASLADNVGDSLRFVYQSDDNTGNELQGGGVAPTRLLYYAFPTNALPSGNLEGPHLFVSPRQLNFGRGFIGDTSAARVIALRSTGTEPVTISSILLAGADFKLLNVPATPMVLLPDSSIIFQAAFAPTVSGILTGSLTITSDDADEPNQAVTLQGLGFLPPPLGTALYVVNEFTGNINQIDPLSGTILNNIPVPVQTFNGVSGLAFDGVSLFYTPGFGFNQIYELDPETGQVRNSFVTPQGVPVDALAHSGSSLFATAFGSTTIYELDPSTGQILNTITAPFFLRGGMTYGGKRQSLFAQTEFGQVVELDPFNGEILHSFPAAPGEFYTGLGYSNGLGVLFAGSSFSGNVFALDPDNGGILATFPIFDLFFASLSGLAADESLVLSGPHLLARPESISFGKVGLGKPSAAQRITLRNIGTENVIVSGVSRADASFQLLDLPDFPLTLAPATFASFLVAYSPEQPVAANDTLKISSNDVDGPVQFVSLSGFGVRPPRPGTLFASTGRIDSLLTIDPATGQSAVVGSTAGFGGITEIEFREDGVLFGATDQGQIVRLDPITGAPTLVASPFGQIAGMEFDAIGRLFGTFTNFSGDISQLVTIDPITGFFTFIGSTGFRNVGGLAFAPDGTLLGVTGGFFEGGDLIRINISTGRGTLIGRTGFRDVAALEFDRLGKLYGGLGPNDPNAGRIIAINPASAAGTLIGPSGFPEISGLAFLPGFDVTVAIGDTLKGEAGTVIEMPVLLELNADSVGSLGAVLKASGGILSFAGFTPGPIVPGAVFNVFSPAPDSVHIGFANLSGGSITQDGLLVTLRFALVANAPLGTTALLKFTEVSASDPQGDMLVAGGVNGLLTVVKFVIVAGNVGYCRPLDSTEPAIPVPALTAGMSQNNVVVRQTTTDAGGNFALANIVAGPNYSLSVRRASGGLDSAVHVTDAFLAFNGFLGTVALSGCQNLAADVDSNLSVQPRDALLIFNFFLGRLEAFPVEAWRAFPASYAIDASPIAWKKAPESIDYPNVSDNLNDQNFFAIARGDVDLSWPDTSSASSLAKAAELDGAAPAPLQLAVNSLPIAPDAKRVSWQILLEGSKVSHGIFAFGAELRYDAAELKISQVHWGNIVPAEGFMLDYNILPATAAPANEMDKPGGEELVSRMRFGGFATAGGSIRTNGVLLEVEAQLQNALPVGTRLPLRLVNVAVTTRAFTANQTANASFAQIKVPAKNGVVVTATVPARYALEANYPNPFNPSTRIRYQLPEAASVKLEIFNALGQKVRELVKDEQQAAGYYTIAWDGRNALGAASTSGVYFLKLEAKSATKSFTQSHKMLLVK